MLERKYYQTITELDASGFKPLPKKIATFGNDDNVEQMRENLWSMFTLPYTPEKRAELIKEGNHTKQELGLSVSDYGWTDKVKQAFYDHPHHKKLVKKLGPKGMAFFGLQCEPADIT